MLTSIVVSLRKCRCWWRAQLEAKELVAQARDILEGNRYRLAELVFQTISEVIADVKNAQNGDDVEVLRKAIGDLKLVMNEHLAFAWNATRTPSDSESRTNGLER
jgi:hypothetical protein